MCLIHAEIHSSHLLQALASNLLGRAKELANNDNLRPDVQFQLNFMLANKELEQAEHLLAQSEADGSINFDEAVGLLNTINEFIGNVEADDEDPAWETKAAAVIQMQNQVLLYLGLFCCMITQCFCF